MTDKKPSICWDQHVNKIHEGHTALRHLMRPFLIIMAVCECHTYDPGTETTGRPMYGHRPCRIFWALYRILCLLICVASCIKAAAAFLYIPPRFFQLNIVKTIWYIECLVVFLIWFKSSYTRQNNHEAAFDFWDGKLIPEIEQLGLHLPMQTIQNRRKVYIISAIVIRFVNAGCSTLMVTDVIAKGFGSLMVAPFAPSLPALITECYLIVLITMIWVVPVFYTMVVAKLLTISFEVFKQFVENHIKQNDVGMTNQCQMIRLLHLNLTKMVSQLDKDFGYYFAAMFVFSIGLSCFFLYQIVRTQMDTLLIVVFLVWVTTPLCLLALASCSAAMVNDKAHRALEYVYYIDVKDMSVEDLGQMNLFLSKLTGTQIGFTTLGLLTITKEFLLTIVGAFLTYFFLLYTLRLRATTKQGVEELGIECLLCLFYIVQQKIIYQLPRLDSHAIYSIIV